MSPVSDGVPIVPSRYMEEMTSLMHDFQEPFLWTLRAWMGPEDNVPQVKKGDLQSCMR